MYSSKAFLATGPGDVPKDVEIGKEALPALSV